MPDPIAQTGSYAINSCDMEMSPNVPCITCSLTIEFAFPDSLSSSPSPTHIITFNQAFIPEDTFNWIEESVSLNIERLSECPTMAYPHNSDTISHEIAPVNAPFDS